MPPPQGKMGGCTIKDTAGPTDRIFRESGAALAGELFAGDDSVGPGEIGKGCATTFSNRMRGPICKRRSLSSLEGFLFAGFCAAYSAGKRGCATRMRGT